MRVFLVAVVALTLQTSLVADLQLFGATGDIMLLLAIAAGLAAGAEAGAIVGFVAGILFDLVLRSPFGLSALTYCITGYIVGSFRGSVLRSSWWIPVAAAVPASMFGVALFALLGTVLGQESYVSSHLFAIMGVVAVVNALLIVPAVRVMRWALAVDTRPRLGPARA